MCPYCPDPLRRLLTLSVAALVISTLACSCKSRISAPESGRTAISDAGGGFNPDSEAARSGERFDADQEEVIARETLDAWHVALAHRKHQGKPDAQWLALRAADEKKSIEQLTALAERYPKSSTVQFMMGQVREHFGHKKEAAQLYKAAMGKNRGTMYLFKLAETTRTSGNDKQSIEYYRELLKVDPEFSAGQLGLAEALAALDKNSPEARSLTAKVLEADPENKQARQLEKRLAGGKKHP